MGLEAVKDEIIGNAKSREESLLAEAREESSKIMKEAEDKIEQFREKSDAEIKGIIDVLKKQELASAELENKKMILETKKQLIENVFTEAKKKLDGLSTEKRRAYIKKLFEKAKKDLGVVNVYCNKKDLGFLKDSNAKTADIAGGLIAENKDGTISVDYSFETLVQSIKESELQSINKLLFS